MSTDNPVYSYTLKQAIEDGVLAEICKNRWGELSNGKPIVATEHLFNEVSLAGLMEIWNEYVQKRKPEDNPFVTKMNGKDVWVMEDDAAFTLLYPEDY